MGCDWLYVAKALQLHLSARSRALHILVPDLFEDGLAKSIHLNVVLAINVLLIGKALSGLVVNYSVQLATKLIASVSSLSSNESSTIFTFKTLIITRIPPCEAGLTCSARTAYVLAGY